uniref:Uncharacterized protein n=1 Tax=Arundo donax TaxID=35708 RepID=A0A0A9DFK8_ARUDO
MCFFLSFPKAAQLKNFQFPNSVARIYIDTFFAPL